MFDEVTFVLAWITVTLFNAFVWVHAFVNEQAQCQLGLI